MTETTNSYKYYNNSFFSKWAWLYDYERYIFSPLRRYVANFLNLKSPKKILDVATGIGAQAYELAKLGHEVVGIDLSPEMLTQAKKKMSKNLKLKFQEADGIKLPFKDNVFMVLHLTVRVIQTQKSGAG